MRASPRHLRLFGAVCVLLASLAAVLLGPGTATAHTGFESSVPAEGAVVTEPVDTVTITFTGPAIPVGDKFVALDADGGLRTPDHSTEDGLTFVLTFDPPLAGGMIGLRWSVQAPDAHPIEGAFAFTVDAPTPAASTTSAGASTTSTVAPVAVPDDAGARVSPDVAPSLEEFLAVNNSRPGESVALAGRVVGLLGIAFAIGGLAFMATTFRGSRAEIGAGLTALRALGGAVAAGAVLELVSEQRAGNLSLDALGQSPGLAMLLRLVGGVCIAVGLVAVVQSGGRPQSLSAAIVDAPVESVRSAESHGRMVRWHPAPSKVALAGAGVILASFWFDGHTISKGPRFLHSLLTSVHVAAGAVWAGGVVSMAVVAWWRYRRGVPTRTAELVVRFSSVATVALVTVGVAGVAMAVFVLDSFAELTGTEWGKILLLKTAFVAIAAAGGAYNHFRLLPALDRARDDEELAAEVRSTVTAEAIILTFVVVVTAWLVAATS